MNKSPWAKRSAVDTGRGPAAFSGAGPSGGGRGGGRAPSGPQGGATDVPDDGPGGGGPGGGGGGGGGPIGATPEALVRWESALPILEAQKRPLPDAFRGSYAISVTGFPMGGPRPGGGGPGGPGGGGAAKGGGGFNLEAMRAAQAQMFEQAKQSTRLERKGKDPIAPAVIGMTGRSLVILFPQGTQPISLDDKEVTLVLKVGLPEMKAKFSLKEMVYLGKLEL